jgi:hypothetical protein
MLDLLGVDQKKDDGDDLFGGVKVERKRERKLNNDFFSGL